MERNIELTQEEITLGQFLKFAGLIDSGGATRWYLSEHVILVNGEVDQRRGRKLHPGDQVQIEGVASFHLQRRSGL